MTYNEQFDLPYDPNSQAKQSGNLPLDEVIRRAILQATLKMRVCMPCSIVKVSGNQKVDIQPLLQARYTDGTVVNLSVIQNVPVSMPMGKDYSIKLPIAVGDTGYCIFSDRSLDAWLAGSGNIVDPEDSRQHDLSDPIFVPGLVPFANQTTDSTTDMVLTNGKAQAKIQKPGTFVFTNAQNELVDLLSKITEKLHLLSDKLSTDTVNTMLGPEQLNAFAFYAQLATDVETLKGKLDTLKGS